MSGNFLYRNWTIDRDDRMDILRYFQEPYPYYRDAKKATLITENEYYFIDFFGYKKIIFNNPATIVLWNDGTKTVVKCQNGEIYDKEKGIALCFMKRALGNKGNFNNVIKKAIQKESKDA